MNVSKLFLMRALVTAVFIGSGLSSALFFDFIQQSSNLPVSREAQSGAALLAANTTTISEQEQVHSGLPASAGRPVRFKIPKINVDAAVEYVGRLPDGAMDIPKSPDDVAWFEPGTRPGENGSAVIAGHYGWKNRKAAAFDNLYTLQKGDKVYVEDEKGVTLTFVVRESRRYDPNADASDVFGSSDGKAHLNLITCEGEWDKTQKSYSQRLVVFADKEME